MPGQARSIGGLCVLAAAGLLAGSCTAAPIAGEAAGPGWPAAGHAGAVASGRPRHVDNAALAELVGATSAAAAAPAGFGLSGRGIRVGVWDEGIARPSHVDLRGRVTPRDLGGLGEHATHTTATIAGSGQGNRDARGIAPDARIWAYDWLLDLAEVEAAAPGLSVSSHAYGLTLGWSLEPACPDRPTWWGGQGARTDALFGRYGADAAGVDALVRRSDLPMVWPAGNERSDLGVLAGDAHYHAGSCSDLFRDAHVQEHTLQYGLLSGAALAKNALTVGAARNVARDALAPARIVALDMSSFGPSGDGRIKPEIVAGGEAVRSASKQGDSAYSTLSGTSSATAATAGVIALLAEHYRNTHAGADPGAAEMRALLVHSAREAGALGPDYGTGYGLLDAQAAAQLISDDAAQTGSQRMLRVGVLRDATTLEIETAAIAADAPLRVTLAWNDVPGALQTGAALAQPLLVNDLDLELIAPGGASVLYPWSLDPAHPTRAATRDGANHADNLEVVDVASGHDAGRFRVRVRAPKGLLRGVGQAFALVASAPLAPVDQPALAAPRYVTAELGAGTSVKSLAVSLANRGTGELGFSAHSLTPWLAVSASGKRTPAQLEIEIDASMLQGTGEWLGRIAIDSDDPAGTRMLGVVARAACVAQCGQRSCGTDPQCGQPCGGCKAGELCQDGTCAQASATCPQVELGSGLGFELLSGDFSALRDEQTGSCGAGGPDLTALFRAASAGRYAFTTRGSLADTALYARATSCDGADLACNDDSGGVSSALALDLAAGDQVALSVDGPATGKSTTFALNAARLTCPSVDLGSRLGLGIVHASTFGGIDVLNGQCGGKGGEDVTLRWTAPAAAKYRFALFQPSFAAVLYVRDGDCDGAELGCSAAADVGPLEIALDAGQAVVVVVDGNDGRSGTFDLDITDSAGTCAGRCDGSSAQGTCACDSACVAAGDCCTDACSACGACRCQPSCAGHGCGGDGCGGRCGDCAAGEACRNGACVADACAGVKCDACSECRDGACRTLAAGAACEDGDPCTVRDTCHGGRCSGVALDCDDGFACTIDRCSRADGTCMHASDPACCSSDAGGCDAGACDAGSASCGHRPDAGPSGQVTFAHAHAHGGGCDCSVLARARGRLPRSLWLGACALLVRARRRRRAR